MITNDARCTREIKARIATAKAAFNNKNTLFTSKLDFELRKKLVKKISWTDRVNNEAVLHRVKEERNILHTIKRGKANWTGHILRRNCLLKHIIEGKIIETRRRGRRHKQLLDDLKEARRYCKLRELRIALFGELSLEKAMDLPQDRLLLDLIISVIYFSFIDSVTLIIVPS
jgi:hypothetical protein